MCRALINFFKKSFGRCLLETGCLFVVLERVQLTQLSLSLLLSLSLAISVKERWVYSTLLMKVLKVHVIFFNDFFLDFSLEKGFFIRHEVVTKVWVLIIYAPLIKINYFIIKHQVACKRRHISSCLLGKWLVAWVPQTLFSAERNDSWKNVCIRRLNINELPV